MIEFYNSKNLYKVNSATLPAGEEIVLLVHCVRKPRIDMTHSHAIRPQPQPNIILHSRACPPE